MRSNHKGSFSYFSIHLTLQARKLCDLYHKGHLSHLISLHLDMVHKNHQNLACTKRLKLNIDLFHLGSLFSQCRPRDILWRISPLSILKLSIHIPVTIQKFESKNAQEYSQWSTIGKQTAEANEVYYGGM